MTEFLSTTISFLLSALIGFGIVYTPFRLAIWRYTKWLDKAKQAFDDGTPVPDPSRFVRLFMKIFGLENFYKLPPPQRVIISPFDQDVIGPGDPGWEIFEKALNSGKPVWGTFNHETGEYESHVIDCETDEEEKK